jgi:hypothetical protein
VSFSVQRGRFTISNPSITDTDLSAILAATGVPVTAARSFNISFDVAFPQVIPNPPSISTGSEVGVVVTASPTATVNSITILATSVRADKFTANTVVEVWGASDPAIYGLLGALLVPTSCVNFVYKASQD